MIKVPQLSNSSYLIRQLPTPTAIINSNDTIVQTSDKWLSTFGEDMGRGIQIFSIFSEVSAKWKQVLKNCFKGSSQHMGIHRALDVNANECWFEWSVAPWFDEQENAVGAIIQLNDVTDSINSQVELNKKKIQLRQQSELNKIGRWEYDIIENRLTWCNTTKAIHEVPPYFIPNIESAIYYYKEGHSRNAISMVLYEAQNHGKPWEKLKLQIITGTGREKWIESCGKPVYNKGELVGLLGTFHDVHDQVEADIKSLDNEKLLRTLIDHLPVNVYIKDTESRKILVNKAECDYLGVKDSSEVLGKSDFELYPEESATRSREEDVMVMNTLKPIIGKETINVKQNGEETAFLSSKIPLLNTMGVAYGMVGISLDITALKEKERELRNIINIASIQNKKLLNFAHIVSHNLRSHSANFSMLLSFLESETDEKEKEGILKMLMDSSNNLLETLDNLNEVVSINTNAKVDKKSINLYRKVETVHQHLSAYLLNNRALIENEIPVDFKIKSVPAYLDSMLTNFITNAVKYKDESRTPVIRMGAYKTEKYSVITISDNGLGIDLEKNGKKLFGMYKTFHDHKEAKGIGLYITKNQIEAMGGKIEVSSELGKGTEFKVFFNEKN
ncbi:MAG: PAS domain-containing protein [Maribacter sp.]